MSQSPIGRYSEQPAACLPHDSRTGAVAERVAEMITGRLPTVVVDHIGSTSVPGCAGKGVVDLMVAYPPGKLQAVKDVLDVLGFQRQTTRDPFPEDRPMRVGSLVYEGATFRLHIHVIAADSVEAGALRAFRDRLRAEPDLREAYVTLKRAILAAGVTDSVDYADRKGAFFTAPR